MTFVHRAAKLRFVDRAPKDASWRKLHAVAEGAVPAAERAFYASLRDFRSAIDMDEFARAIALRTDADMAIVMLPWAKLERSLERRLLPILRDVRDGGAEAAAQNLATLFRRRLPILKAKDKDKPGVGGEVRFDLRNPRAERFLAQYGSRLVTLVTNETRAAIRQITLRAQEQGIDVRGQAKQIAEVLRRDVGLTAPQARALVNLERNLVERDTPPVKVKQMVAERRETMIAHRSRTIARNETLSASHAGQQEVWRQAKDQRLISAGTKRKWLTQGRVNPDNPCPICAPMNGQVRGLEEDFVSPHSGARVLMPPVHVACVCAVVLEIEDPE